MSIPRLPFFALLISVCVAPVAAQSSPVEHSPSKTGVSSQPQLDGLVAPPEFRTRVPALPPIVQDKIAQPKIHATPLQWQSQVLPFRPKAEPNDGDCLYIRAYRVTRDDPESDATRLAGYSTCQTAARFQTKSAVETLDILRR
jgi:hypothetical protein